MPVLHHATLLHHAAGLHHAGSMRYIAAALLAIAVATSAGGVKAKELEHPRECRQFTQEYRAGGNMSDRKGVMCKQPDGTWQQVDGQTRPQEPHIPRDEDFYSKGGYYIRPEKAPSYPADIPSHTHYFDNGVGVVVTNPPYVVVDPFYNYGHRRGWDASKRHFNHHHRGPGWEKHWQHHQRALGK